MSTGFDGSKVDRNGRPPKVLLKCHCKNCCHTGLGRWCSDSGGLQNVYGRQRHIFSCTRWTSTRRDDVVQSTLSGGRNSNRRPGRRLRLGASARRPPQTSRNTSRSRRRSWRSNPRSASAATWRGTGSTIRRRTLQRRPSGRRLQNNTTLSECNTTFVYWRLTDRKHYNDNKMN